MDNKISIIIQLFAHYRENRFKVEKREYTLNTTANDVIEELGIHKEPYPFGFLMVNSKHQELNYILQEGDILALFPKVGGG